VDLLQFPNQMFFGAGTRSKRLISPPQGQKSPLKLVSKSLNSLTQLLHLTPLAATNHLAIRGETARSVLPPPPGDSIRPRGALSVYPCKNYDVLLTICMQKRPSVIILNQYNPEGEGCAKDACRDIKKMLDNWGVDVTFFVITKDQVELEMGRVCNSIVPCNNWISEPLSVDYLRTRIRMSILRSQPKWDLVPIHKNENKRLKALCESCVLDITGHPESLSRIGRIARQLFSVSVVAFSLLDAKTIKFITVESEENFGLYDILQVFGPALRVQVFGPVATVPSVMLQTAILRQLIPTL
jgi:hypothetical protein